MPHKWLHDDDVLTFYLYRYGEDDIISLGSVAKHIDIKFTNTDSLKMRIRNFKAVDGKGGLPNRAPLTKEVYNEYLNVDQKTHRKKCLEIMKIT